MQHRFVLSGSIYFGVLASSLLSEAAGDGYDEHANRFRSEYPHAADKLERPLVNIRCKAEGGNLPKYACASEFFVKGDSRLALLNYDPQKKPSDWGASKVFCITPDDMFELEQTIAGGPFLVRQFSKDPALMKRSAFSVELVLDVFVFASHRLFDVPVRNLLSDPRYTVTAVSEISIDDQQLIEVLFDVSEGNYKSGRVALSPTLDWAIREYEIVLKSGPGDRATRKGTVECERWIDGGHVFPTKVEIVDHTVTADGKEYESLRRAEFSDVTLNKVSDSQFALAAFGLPDLTLVPRRSYYPFDSWLFWACALTAVASGALLWYKYRRAA